MDSNSPGERQSPPSTWPAVGDKVVYCRPLPAEGDEGPAVRRLREVPSVVVDTDPASGEVAVYDPEAITNLFWAPAEHWWVDAKATHIPVLTKADGSVRVIPARPASAVDSAVPAPDALIEPAVEVRYSKRGAYTAGLRQLADLLDAHSDWPLPWYGAGSPITMLFLGDDAKERFAAAARAFPGSLTKKPGEKFFDLAGSLHGLTVELTAYRDVVCERVVVGVETVTKQVPDPAVVVPTVEVTETLEQVEWRCSPVLAAAVPDQTGDVR